MTEQLDAGGRLRHLLSLDGLDAACLTRLLDRAEGYCARPGRPAPRTRQLADRTIVNLFFENSTRTRASFELAARRLGAEVLNLNLDTSSAQKGESLLDTFYTLQAMNVDGFVVRHAEAGIPARLAEQALPHEAIINAGEGSDNHPTQGLLDVLTIRQHKPRLEELTVAIVGDIRHSRVASSAARALHTLGVGELRLAAPVTLLPDPAHLPGRHLTDIEAALDGADVIMMLRIQKERMRASDIPDDAAYHAQWGLTEERLRHAAPDALVMHPGPMNRGVEIADAVADGPQSVIREQVNNGVAVRMAVLAELLEHRKP